VRNRVVVSVSPSFVIRDDNGYKLIPDELFTSRDLRKMHMYIITDQGNSVVEATKTEEYANGNIGTAYQPILNGVTAEDIVYYGHAALTQDERLYGGHLGDGAFDPERTRRAKEYSLERYNEELKNNKVVVGPRLNVTPKAQPVDVSKPPYVPQKVGRRQDMEARVFPERGRMANYGVTGGSVQPESGRGEHVPPPRAIPNSHQPHSPPEKRLGLSQGVSESYR
jgi:hypothetical protein